MQGFIKAGADDALARKLVEAIARQEIPNIKIEY